MPPRSSVVLLRSTCDLSAVLDLKQLREQFGDFHVYQTEEHRRLRACLERAVGALEDCRGEWEALRARAEQARVPWLVALLREDPGRCLACGDRPTPLTVVATDGSQIFPDRNVAPTCYVLNISRIAFQYGTLEEPLMEAVPALHYRRDDLQELFDEMADSASAEVVSALRDELELRHLLEVARQARMDGRPLLALADGTLIRWMLRGMRDRELEERLIERYTRLLAAFREERLPVCSYISMPGNTEVVNLLRVHRGEADAQEPPEDTLAGLADRRLFEEVLAPGQRSAVFEAASHIQERYGVDRICYFYVHVPASTGAGEIARVEVPRWVADEPELLELVHSTVLSECEKGDGYPVILAEAHERAVIRAHEKEVFYDLIERRMNEAGLRFRTSRKHASKRRPVV